MHPNSSCEEVSKLFLLKQGRFPEDLFKYYRKILDENDYKEPKDVNEELKIIDKI